MLCLLRIEPISSFWSMIENTLYIFHQALSFSTAPTINGFSCVLPIFDPINYEAYVCYRYSRRRTDFHPEVVSVSLSHADPYVKSEGVFKSDSSKLNKSNTSF